MVTQTNILYYWISNYYIVHNIHYATFNYYNISYPNNIEWDYSNKSSIYPLDPVIIIEDVFIGCHMFFDGIQVSLAVTVHVSAA